jgi:hypothetical protein
VYEPGTWQSPLRQYLKKKKKERKKRKENRDRWLE